MGLDTLIMDWSFVVMGTLLYVIGTIVYLVTQHNFLMPGLAQATRIVFKGLRIVFTLFR